MVGTLDADPLAIEAPAISRRRRKKSLVWEHFTVEAIAGGSTRACCKLCKQTFAYSSGSKIAGTSHLKRHITMGSCPKIREEKKQLALTSGTKSDDNASDPPAKRRYRTSSLYLDQDRSCEDLAKMIAMLEYPLHTVEHPAFTAFIQGLQPRFKMPSVDAIESEILSIFQKEKQNLTQLFGSIPGRVSLTVGLWTTAQTLGYVCLTGHFIDNDWKLHKRMLNFTMVTSPHSENALSEVIGFSLSDWNMKTKLFTITLDNHCSSHDIYSANLRDHLSNKNTLMLKGQLFVVRCYAHIINVVAQDVLASIHGIIYNIRESMKYVKASQAREEKFAEISQQLQIPSTKSLTLDIQSHWNTTYLMLAGALEFRHAVTSLESSDPNYNEAPSSDDWKKVETVCTYLKLFYDSANSIMAAADPTSNLYFHEVWKIQLELTRATVSEDTVVSSIAKEMHEKFDKYWKDCSLVLAVAVVMDPRFKMKLVEFSFTKIYGTDAASYLKVVNDGIHDLYLEYVAQPLPLTPAYVAQQADANHYVGPSYIEVPAATEAMDCDAPSAVADTNSAEPTASDASASTTPATDAAASTAPASTPADAAASTAPAATPAAASTAPADAAASTAPASTPADAAASTAAAATPAAASIAPADAPADASTAPATPAAASTAPADATAAANTAPATAAAAGTTLPAIAAPAAVTTNNGTARPGATLRTGDGLLDFDIYISETSVNQHTKSELDQYLEETLVPRVSGFDILNWWKLNEPKYPTLSKMAREVLAIPMSIVPSSSIFSTGTGSRLLDEYRSSLRPETVEALFCTKDWLQYVPMSADGPSTAIVKMDF